MKPSLRSSDSVSRQTNVLTRPVKIVATLGPASSDAETLRQMLRAGMNVARLNFSHGTHEEQGRRIEALRRVALEEGTQVAILQDICGPKIRVGEMEPDSELRVGEPFTLRLGTQRGDSSVAYVDDAVFFEELEQGDHLLLADGGVELAVEEVSRDRVVCRVLGSGSLGSGKGINVPRGLHRRPVLTEKDLDDLAFGAEIGVDWVAVSFVRRAEDLHYVRREVAKAGLKTPLMAKIETASALEHLEDIIDAADGVLLARGDLALETPYEQVPLVQKRIIEEAHRRGKPVITATQMMASMVEAFRPTRAEVNDVANAVIDGTDAVMLSEETAIGAHPPLVVGVMARIALSASSSKPPSILGPEGLPEELHEIAVVAEAAASAAKALGARGLLTWTEGGLSARMLSRASGEIPIVAPTSHRHTARLLCVLRGVVPVLAENWEVNPEDVRRILDVGANERGSLVVFGHELGEDGSRLAWMRIARLDDPSTWIPPKVLQEAKG